jgi:hypothetical protein
MLQIARSIFGLLRKNIVVEGARLCALAPVAALGTSTVWKNLNRRPLLDALRLVFDTAALRIG